MHENKIFSGGGFIKEKSCDMLNPESVLSKIFRKEDDCRMVTDNELIKNLDKLHTTDLGVVRIKRNLSLETEDVVLWCKEKTESPEAVIIRKGKNWYVDVGGSVITINAHSYTIITAHKK